MARKNSNEQAKKQARNGYNNRLKTRYAIVLAAILYATETGAIINDNPEELETNTRNISYEQKANFISKYDRMSPTYIVELIQAYERISRENISSVVTEKYQEREDYKYFEKADTVLLVIELSEALKHSKDSDKVYTSVTKLLNDKNFAKGVNSEYYYKKLYEAIKKYNKSNNDENIRDLSNMANQWLLKNGYDDVLKYCYIVLGDEIHAAARGKKKIKDFEVVKQVVAPPLGENYEEVALIVNGSTEMKIQNKKLLDICIKLKDNSDRVAKDRNVHEGYNHDRNDLLRDAIKNCEKVLCSVIELNEDEKIVLKTHNDIIKRVEKTIPNYGDLDGDKMLLSVDGDKYVAKKPSIK